MAPIAVLALGVLALVALPRRARPAIVVVLAAAGTALVIRALTDDTALVLGGAVVGALTAVLVREIAGTFRLLAQPSPDARSKPVRHAGREQREPTAEERELRRRTREERRRRDRLAA
ncbi:MAG: hypothetical protein U0R69_08275 [Gaiellales bacterium]